MPSYCVSGGRSNFYTAITRIETNFFYRGNDSLLYEVHKYTKNPKYENVLCV